MDSPPDDALDPAHGAAREGAVPEDETLIAALRAGKREAFDALVEAYYAGLRAYLASHTGSVDVAEDLMQDLFVRLWHGRATLRAPAGLRAYLYTAARNQLKNDRRAQRRVQARNTRLTHELIDAQREVPGLDAQLDLERLSAAVEQAVERLSPGAREIWRLYRDHGLSYPEIAAVLGVSVSTVKTQMSRALAVLRGAVRPLL